MVGAAAFVVSLFFAQASYGATQSLIAYCDPGQVLSRAEREALINKLRISKTGQLILKDFDQAYGSLENLLIQWDKVSYSQVVTTTTTPSGSARTPAGISDLGNAVCVHLTRQLPQIEHVADLAHELAHATRLERRVLRGEVSDVQEFVHTRITARGGEADAFSIECAVKYELLGDWDSLCRPYALSEAGKFDSVGVVRDFYNGQLSASLTGETYPVMLSRQYRAMLNRKAVSQIKK